MKKVVLIVGGIAAAAVAAITVLSWFALSKAEKDANAKRTEAARQARWKKDEETELNQKANTVSDQ